MIKYFKRIIEGLSIGGQEGLAKSLNNVFDILENLEGAPFSGIKINRNGNIWRINYDGVMGGSGEAWDGTAPSGYEWEELTIVTDSGIRKRKVLVEIPPTPSTDIEWDADDARLLLQVKGGTGDDAGKLRIDKGYLVE